GRPPQSHDGPVEAPPGRRYLASSGPRLFRFGSPLLETILKGAQPLTQRGDFVSQSVGIRLGSVALGRFGLAPRLGARPRRPAGSRRPLAEHAFHLALTGDDTFQARFHRALDEVVPRLAVLDELMEERRRQRAPVVALVLENDLGECHRRQVFAGSG